MAPRRTTAPPAVVAAPSITVKPVRTHHVVVEYLSTNEDAYEPDHTIGLAISGQVNVRLVSFFGTPGQLLAVHLTWGTNTRTISADGGSPSSLLALIAPDAAGNSTVSLGPAVHRTIPSGPTTMSLKFYDATLPMGTAAETYPDNFKCILEVTPIDSA